MNRAQLAALIDHTLLRPEATRAEVDELCRVGLGLGTASVCVNPARVGQVAGLLAGSPVRTCSVVGFPFGVQDPMIGAAETRRVVDAGADEVDMVVPLGLLADGDHDAVQAAIAAVREAAVDRVLKVILETGLLDPAGIESACRLAAGAGADFVKTSTGFHPSGGATVEAVKVMAQTVPGLGVKAAGGIRTLADAQRMLDAGATRLGCSATAAILDELAA